MSSLSISRIYDEWLPTVESVGSTVKETLINFCERNEYAFTYRVKKLESLVEKLESGRYKTWLSIDDLVACTIIIPTLADEKKVVEFCKRAFSVQEIKWRGKARKPSNVFRFDSTRVYANLSNDERYLNVGEASEKVLFEIQIRSAFEHAWVVATHDLVYKTNNIDWKRLRVASQIKAAVEQLDTAILAFERIAPVVKESPDSHLADRRSIAESCQKWFQRGVIPSELKPKDVSRFCDNLLALRESSSWADAKLYNLLNSLEETFIEAGSKNIPRSLTLFQYVFCLMAKDGQLSKMSGQYYCVITEEMEGLFPSLSTIDQKRRFEFQHPG